MMTLRRRWQRLRAVLKAGALDVELDDEIAAHVDMATAEQVARGVEPAEARRRALAALGGVEAAKARHRDARGLPWLRDVLHDVRYAIRSLGRTPAFALTAVLLLGTGIGLNTAVFSVTDAMLFKGYARVPNGRILYLQSQSLLEPREYGYPVSRRAFEAWRAQTTMFTEMGAYSTGFASLSDEEGLPERAYAGYLSADVFSVLEQTPLIGRSFVEADERPGAPAVVVLSHALWQRRYHSDATVVGRTVRISGVPTTVVGVMREGLTFPQDSPFWLPLPASQTDFGVCARLAAGATREQAEAEMDAIGRQLAASAETPDERALRPLVWNFRQGHTGRPDSLLYRSMWGAVSFLLAIACANLAGLSIARTTARHREISVRLALGAARWRIVRQLFVESAVLFAAAGLIGWWIAQWSVHAYVTVVFRGNSWYDFSVGPRTLAYLVAVAGASTLLAGLVPALRASAVDMGAALKDGGRGAVSGSTHTRASRLLVAAEVALAVVLLAGVGVIVRGFMAVYRADIGVTTSEVAAVRYQLPSATYHTGTARLAFHDRLSAEVATMPGVEDIAFADHVPTGIVPEHPYQVFGAPAASEHAKPAVPVVVISGSYFKTLGASVVAGRSFNDGDQEGARPVAIVNQRFAAAQWPDSDPLGQRIRLDDGATPEGWLTVVGVASNIVQNDWTRQVAGPVVYLPYRQSPTAAVQMLVKSPRAASSLAPDIRRAARAIDRDMPVVVLPLAELLASGYGITGFDAIAGAFTTFGVMALALASLGLYTLAAHATIRRTQEIGVRVALGATARDIMQLVATQGLWPLVIGLAVGLPAAFTITPLLRSAIVETPSLDPLPLAGAYLVLGATGLLGCLVPAWRASRLDPVAALREQA